MAKLFPALDPADYPRHALHASDRDWPETNCYLDVWIELLNALDLPPEAALGYSITQDFEGDQFTFFKVPLEDLETLFGIRVTELAIYDRVENHVLEQLKRGRAALVEVDSFFLPDTHGTSYRTEHGKTTVAVNRLDIETRSMDYFHGLGLFRLEGEDFDGIFQRGDFARDTAFLPYTEFVKFPEGRADRTKLPEAALGLLAHHLARRPEENPIAKFAEVFPGQVEEVAGREFGFFHLYAFNTLRQLGANFELFSSHLAWLTGEGAGDFSEGQASAKTISEACKIAQFQLARALARKKFDKLAPALVPAVEAWGNLVDSLEARVCAKASSRAA
ncbi:DUF1839 family protein [Stappia sp. GBMRC 2046]|uniref:DUF1839 family protein n=1 Tax=Stappia sediminis TaxID=2692190 RepID=A0A7X3S985_9HYPH|nr:DUF1839 family protein [Stappia sediminis]MXN66613.1 DUF1839 family protein [Stappia sediminis]